MFGDLWCLFKSLRERSAEFVKYVFFQFLRWVLGGVLTDPTPL